MKKRIERARKTRGRYIAISSSFREKLMKKRIESQLVFRPNSHFLYRRFREKLMKKRIERIRPAHQ